MIRPTFYNLHSLQPANYSTNDILMQLRQTFLPLTFSDHCVGLVCVDHVPNAFKVGTQLPCINAHHMYK